MTLWLIAISTILLGVQNTILNMPHFYLSCYRFKLPNNIDSQKIITNWWQDWLGEQCIPIQNDENWSQIVSIFYLGGLLGTVFTDFNNFYHTLPLKWVMIFNQLLIVFGNFLLSISNNLQIICLSRLIIGLGTGGQFNIIPTYLQLFDEIYQWSKKTNNGNNNSFNIYGNCFNYLLYPVGILSVQVLSLPFLDSFHWRWIPFTWFMINLIQLFLLIFFLIESPKWYLVNGNSTMASKILLKYINTENNENYTLHDSNTESNDILSVWQHELEIINQDNPTINTTLNNWNNKIKFYFQFIIKTYKENNFNIHSIILLQCINFNCFNQYGIKSFIELMSISSSFILQIVLSIAAILSVLIYLFIGSRIDLTYWITLNLKFIYRFKLNIKLIVYLLQISSLLGLFYNFNSNHLTNFVTWLILFTILSHNNIMQIPLFFQTNWTNITEICHFRLIRISYWIGNIIISYSFPLLFDLLGHYIFLIWVIIFTAVLIIDQEILLN